MFLDAARDVQELIVMKQTPPDDFHQRRRANMAALIVVAVLVAGTVVLLISLQNGIKREDCFAAGHHTCAPIDEH